MQALNKIHYIVEALQLKQCTSHCIALQFTVYRFYDIHYPELFIFYALTNEILTLKL